MNLRHVYCFLHTISEQYTLWECGWVNEMATQFSLLIKLTLLESCVIQTVCYLAQANEL